MYIFWQTDWGVLIQFLFYFQCFVLTRVEVNKMKGIQGFSSKLECYKAIGAIFIFLFVLNCRTSTQYKWVVGWWRLSLDYHGQTTWKKEQTLTFTTFTIQLLLYEGSYGSQCFCFSLLQWQSRESRLMVHFKPTVSATWVLLVTTECGK